MGIPLYVICCFSLVAFNIFSLSLIFVILIAMCHGVFLCGFILYGILRASWTWVIVSFPRLRCFQLLSLQIFSQALSLFFWDAYSVNVSVLNVVPEVS